MMSMVERVARAIALDDSEGYDIWADTSQDVRSIYLTNARAAIEAMREPTEFMYRAAYKEQDDSAIHNYGASPTFDDYWSTAIDAALNEQVAG